MRKGMVFDIQRFSLHDGPGIRTLIFLKGCPLKCLWCCNPEGQSRNAEILEFQERCVGCGECVKVCPVSAITEEAWVIDRNLCIGCGKCAEVCPAKARETSGKLLSAKEVFEEIQKDEEFYKESGGGVTLSGGEPSFQPFFVNDLLSLCRENKIHTAIETCGYSEKNVFLGIVENADLLIYDLKQINPVKHINYTGVDNNKILDNLKTILLEKKIVILRIPIIPNYTDEKDNIEGIANVINSFGKKQVIEIQILPYHTLGENKYKRLGKIYELKNLSLISEEKLFKIKAYFESFGYLVKIGG